MRPKFFVWYKYCAKYGRLKTALKNLGWQKIRFLKRAHFLWILLFGLLSQHFIIGVTCDVIFHSIVHLQDNLAVMKI